MLFCIPDSTRHIYYLIRTPNEILTSEFPEEIKDKWNEGDMGPELQSNPGERLLPVCCSSVPYPWGLEPICWDSLCLPGLGFSTAAICLYLLQWLLSLILKNLPPPLYLPFWAIVLFSPFPRWPDSFHFPTFYLLVDTQWIQYGFHSNHHSNCPGRGHCCPLLAKYQSLHSALILSDLSAELLPSFTKTSFALT